MVRDVLKHKTLYEAYYKYKYSFRSYASTLLGVSPWSSFYKLLLLRIMIFLELTATISLDLSKPGK
jgi:hypothetical protein